MVLYDIFRYAHGLFFVTLQTALMFGFFLEWRRDKKALATGGLSSAGGEARVSVIIPIHNESLRMAGLLTSLLEQDFDEGAEIIFVDDRSQDESPAMLRDFAKKAEERGMKECRIITLKENPGPNRKQYALSQGIAQAKGDLLLLTDGDCEVPPGWVRAMAARMRDPNVGVAIGPVFKKKQGKGFFFLYQCFDHVIRYNFLAGSIGLGAAGGGFGNNLIISRAALQSVGGYDAIPPSPTEDAELISQIRKGGKYTVRAISLPDAAVETEAEKTWASFINQTLRWNNGGLFSPERITRFNYNLLMLVITTGSLALFLLPFFPSLWPLPLGVFIAITQNTVAAFALFRTKLPGGGFSTKFCYVLLVFFTPFYFTLMTLMGYFRVKVKWKGNQIPKT
ncbi:MAG: glycosyltransferase [Spirochaetes bacterium]|nr:glycosyltransferase [Spirochaetota bacterium]